MDRVRVRVRITVRVKVRARITVSVKFMVMNRFRLTLTAGDCRYCKPLWSRLPVLYTGHFQYGQSDETQSGTIYSRITISYCVSLIIYLWMIL